MLIGTSWARVLQRGKGFNDTRSSGPKNSLWDWTQSKGKGQPRNGLNGEIDGGRNGRSGGRTQNAVLNRIADSSDARRDNGHSHRRTAANNSWDTSALVAHPDSPPEVLPSAREYFSVLHTSFHPGYRSHTRRDTRRYSVVTCMHWRFQ